MENLIWYETQIIWYVNKNNSMYEIKKYVDGASYGLNCPIYHLNCPMKIMCWWDMKGFQMIILQQVWASQGK